MNIVGNCFYATQKRKESEKDGYKPAILAATRPREGSVEIVVRDNVTGVPEEIKAKMFNPFFTTRPAGEGAELELSLGHDIIVKQLGGSIEVAIALGAFAEFTIRLSRGPTGRALL